MNSEKTSIRIPLTRSLAAIFILLFLSGCSLVGIRSAEEANYSVLDNQDKFEVREYDAMLVTETLVDASFDEAGNIAFKRLFGYISGDNVSASEIAMTAPVLAVDENSSSGEKISMTAPVTGEKSGPGWRFAFVLPAEYTLETAPAPNNSAINLVPVPARKVAVVRYSGTRSETAYETHLKLLQDWMQQNRYQPDSLPRFAGYDPPWTLPFLRRNEVLIDIKS
ncbi:MAG: heme-binding protein [Gammaproteobacteria bacterium]|nr:heme-binding protein [Gammaproteobacteria bacterium]